MKINKFNSFIIMFLMISMISEVNSLLYYEANVNYNRGELKIQTVDIYFTENDMENIYNEDLFNSYELLLTDSQNKVIYKESFSVPNKVWYDIADNNTGELVSGGYYELNETNFFLYIPYNEETKELTISNKNKVLDKRIVSEFSKKGFDNNDYVNSSEIKENNDEKKNINSITDFNLIIVLFIAIILIIIVIIYFLIKEFKK